ncbi:unnamed protein product [Caenorhabditis angaria]|uniref:Reverse transcriptase domain-containing protein n=1 Tax=Caenorhabditis angaria TaxID=860376 RepID=A0A9P1IT31_9PELO|nr:unnamed protein product [Caenorhabditis angaria]
MKIWTTMFGLETRVWHGNQISKRCYKNKGTDGLNAGDKTSNGPRHSPLGVTGCRWNAAGKLTAAVKSKASMMIGTHNVRSLVDVSRRDSENIAATHSRCLVVALQETRISKQQSTITDDGNEFIFCSMSQKRVAGVGFWIKKEARQLVENVEEYGDRIAVMKLSVGPTKIAIINAYAPTTKAAEKDTDQFYKLLLKIYKSIPESWTKIVCGDFNAAIGKTTSEEHPVTGRYGMKNIDRNDNGDALLNFANLLRLSIMNTHFKKNRRDYWTWRNENGKITSMIDFFLVKWSRRFLVKNIDTFDSKFDLSDHRIVRAEIYTSNANINKSTRKPRTPTKTALKLDKSRYATALANCDEMNHCNYETLVNLLKLCAKNSSDPVPKQSKISDETMKLLADRNRILNSNNSSIAERKKISSEARSSMKRDAEKWKCEIIQRAVEKRRSIKKAYRRTDEKSELFGKLKLANGTTTTNRSKIREEVQKHFSEQFKNPGQATQKQVHTPRNPLPILSEEVALAINRLKTKSAMGVDQISGEMLKFGGEHLFRNLARCFNETIENGATPGDWNKIRLKLLEKKKNPECLKDVRPISILSIPGKIYTKVLTKRMMKKSEEYLDESQNGFRPGRSCSENLQSITCLWEKCHEYEIPLVLTFIDYRAAFDSIFWNSVEDGVLESGFEPQYMEAVKSCNEIGTGEVEIFGKKLEIKMERGVRQGDSSSPALFAIALHKLLNEADPLPENDEENNFGIRVNGQYISRLLFADDVVLIDKNPKDASIRASKIAKICEKAGLHFNTAKSKVLRNDCANPASVRVNGIPLEDVDQIKYLGRIFRKDGLLDAEISNRIRAGWAAYHGIASAIENIDEKNKNHFLNSSVMAAITYGSETWNTKVADVRRIQRTISYIWEKAEAGKPPNVEAVIMKMKMRWAGHIIRLPPERICRKLTVWEYPSGVKRRKGRPRKRWADDIQQEVKVHQHNINIQGLGGGGRRRIGIIASKMPWSRMARSRSSWKHLVHSYMLE